MTKQVHSLLTNFIFYGELLAAVNEGSENMAIYKLEDKEKFVVTYVDTSKMLFESVLADSQESIIAFLGTNPLAQTLYNKLANLEVTMHTYQT